MQKKRFNGFYRVLRRGAVLAALISLGACKSTAPAPQVVVEEKPTVGVIGFSDGLPDLDGPWAIYVTREAVSKFEDLQNGMQKCSAYGASTDTTEGKVNLYDIQDSGGAFTGPPLEQNGAYVVIIATIAGTQYLYNPHVIFRDRAALINFKNMTTVSP